MLRRRYYHHFRQDSIPIYLTFKVYIKMAKKSGKKQLYPAIRNASDLEYMRNCLYWISEYEKGNVDYTKYLSAVNNLKIHCQNFIKNNP